MHDSACEVCIVVGAGSGCVPSIHAESSPGAGHINCTCGTSSSASPALTLHHTYTQIWARSKSSSCCFCCVQAARLSTTMPQSHSTIRWSARRRTSRFRRTPTRPGMGGDSRRMHGVVSPDYTMTKAFYILIYYALVLLCAVWIY